MSTLALPTSEMHPEYLIQNLRFVLESDGRNDYRFRQVRLRDRQEAVALENWMVALLEGHSVTEALGQLEMEAAGAMGRTLESVREFLRNLSQLLPKPAGTISMKQEDPLAATESCQHCSKHRMAALHRRNTMAGGPDQCECMREYRLRNAQREAVTRTLHKIAV